jgi:hypothetical protein
MVTTMTMSAQNVRVAYSKTRALSIGTTGEYRRTPTPQRHGAEGAAGDTASGFSGARVEPAIPLTETKGGGAGEFRATENPEPGQDPPRQR